MATNPVSWNFNAFSYLTPIELRSGGIMPYNFNPSVFNASSSGLNTGMYGNQINSNPFGNYSSLGMNGLFNNVGALSSYADIFTAQTASVIAQAEAYNNQLFNQSLYKAQQTSALRDQLKAAGINPDSVLNKTQPAVNTSNNQLIQLLGLLGLGGNTGTATNTSNNLLGSLLGLLGLGGTATNTLNTENSQIDQLAQSLGIGGTTQPAVNTSNNQLNSLLSLLGKTNSTTTTVDDWWNHTDPYSSSSDESDSESDDAFWNYIDAKVAQSKQK